MIKLPLCLEIASLNQGVPFDSKDKMICIMMIVAQTTIYLNTP